MVLPASRWIARVLRYSGTHSPHPSYAYRALTVSGQPFHAVQLYYLRSFIVSPTTPADSRQLVWAAPLSLAATKGIAFAFFSSRYLDVSVPWVGCYMAIFSPCADGLSPPGCPIRISPDHCLLAAPRSFSQLSTSFLASHCLGIHHTPFIA